MYACHIYEYILRLLVSMRVEPIFDAEHAIEVSGVPDGPLNVVCNARKKPTSATDYPFPSELLAA